MKSESTLGKIWRITKRILLILVIAQFVYIILLRWVDPPFTITQLVSWVTGHGLKRDYVDRREMSPNAALAVMSSEDQRFPDHMGFDTKQIEKAMEYNEKHKNKRRGASTISQQTAKNVFLWQGGGFFRKGLEVYFTFMIELCWSKERILEVYLNVAETGDGIFGIEAASQTYFSKPASQLSRQEASYVAALLPNPKHFRIKPPTPYMQKRSGQIMRQMGFLFPDPDVQQILQAFGKKITPVVKEHRSR